MRKRVSGLTTVLPDLLREIIIKESRFISDLNRQQLLRGEKGNGEEMPEYVETSKKSGRIDLFDEGLFHEGIEPLIEEEGFEMVGLDDKTNILIGKYGEILDLNKKSIELLKEHIKPLLIERVENYLNG